MIAVDVAADRYENTAGVCVAVGFDDAEELRHLSRRRRAAEDFDDRCRPRSRRGDDVRVAVAVDVGRGDADAAFEAGRVGEEVEPGRMGRGKVEDAHARRRAGVGAGDHELGDALQHYVVAVAADIADAKNLTAAGFECAAFG